MFLVLAWVYEASLVCYKEALLPLSQNKHFVSMNSERTHSIRWESADIFNIRSAYTGQTKIPECDSMLRRRARAPHAKYRASYGVRERNRRKSHRDTLDPYPCSPHHSLYRLRPWAG